MIVSSKKAASTFLGHRVDYGLQPVRANICRTIVFVLPSTGRAEAWGAVQVEAMAFGNCVVAHNTQENLETLGDAGFAYDGKLGSAGLRQVLVRLLSNPQLVMEYRQRGRQRALDCYSWESVVDSYEKLFYQFLREPIPDRLQLSDS